MTCKQQTATAEVSEHLGRVVMMSHQVYQRAIELKYRPHARATQAHRACNNHVKRASDVSR